MMEQEALEIVRDRLSQKGPGSDAELEQALSTLERVIHLARAQALVAAGALTPAHEDDQVFNAACDAAEFIRDEDIREFLRSVGFTDLAANSTDEDVNHAAVSSVHDVLLPLTEKDSHGYGDFIESAARELVERAGLDWTEAKGGTA